MNTIKEFISGDPQLKKLINQNKKIKHNKIIEMSKFLINKAKILINKEKAEMVNYISQKEDITNELISGHTNKLTPDIQYTKFQNLKNVIKNYKIDKVNYITTVFILKSNKSINKVNYGFLYSINKNAIGNNYVLDRRDNADFLITYNTKKPFIETYTKYNITHEYVCLSPSLISSDGEYRKNFLSYRRISQLWSKNESVFDFIETLLLKKINYDDMYLSVEIHHPQIKSKIQNNDISHSINDEKLEIKFYVYFWIQFIFEYVNKIQDTHMNNIFMKMFMKNVDYNIDIYEHIIQQIGVSNFEYVYSILNNKYKTVYTYSGKINSIQYKSSYHKDFYNMILGQKMVPMTINEVQYPNDVYYNVWREIDNGYRINDLIYNFISPSFPLILGWFYIKNDKSMLFDNEEQSKKIEFSNRSLGIMNKLREAQKLTYVEDKEKSLKYLFDVLGIKIEESVNFTKNNLLMSEVTMTIITQHVGPTLFGLKNLIKSSFWLKNNINIFKNEEICKKLIWDFCYAALCMHEKVGIIHGDIHLNNVTITSINKHLENYNSLYTILEYTFLVPTYKWFLTIIDFSRGISSKFYIDNLQISREKKKKIYKNQTARICKKMETLFPTFFNLNEIKIRDFINKSFSKFFKIYSAVDLYDFSSKFLKVYESNLTNNNKKLLKNIKSISKYYLTSVMLKISMERDTEIEFPAYMIIKELFYDYMIQSTDNVSYINYWNYNKQLIKHDKITTSHILYKNYDIQSLQLNHKNFTNIEKKEFDNLEKKNKQMIDYIATRHKQKFT